MYCRMFVTPQIISVNKTFGGLIMEFDVKQFWYAFLIGATYILVGWACSFPFMGIIGDIIWHMLLLVILFAVSGYALRTVKGIVNGIIAGIQFVVVWLGLYMVTLVIGMEVYAPFPYHHLKTFGALFEWPGIWLPSLAVTMLVVALGYFHAKKS